MDSKTRNTLWKTLGKALCHILFVISLIYLYYWFEKLLILSYNNESIRWLVFSLSVISIIYMMPYSCYFFEPLKNSKILIVSFKIFLLILFWITLLLLLAYLYLNILNSYFKFLLISLNIFLLVWLNLFSSKSYLINLIKYAINRKILYFLPVFLFILILNILMSIHTSFSISLEQSKYLFGVEIKDQWWQFFLLSLVNCLCSVIESTSDTNLTILIALTTIINSILFFASSLIFTQSLIFTIKNKNSIFSLQIINIKKEKKQIYEVYLDKSLIWTPLNIQKLKKEFWDKFEDYYEEIKEIKDADDNYFFVNNNQNTINDQLKYIEEKLKLNKLSYLDKLKQILYKSLFKLLFTKLTYKLFLKLNKLNTQYKKYIDDSNKDINKIKFKKNIDFPRHPKINIKLENINFFNDFQKLIKLEFPKGNVGKLMKDYLYDELAKKYSININEEDKENNYFFSLKTNFSYIPLIQNLDHNRLQRIYYFKFDKKYQIIKSKFEEIKLKILYKDKKVLILQDMDGIEDRTNQIRQTLINTKKYDSELIYQINLESEIEQILTKIKKEDLDAYNQPFFNHWVNAKRRKLKKIKSKKLKNINSFEQSSEYSSVHELIAMHKVIITTTREGKINQSLKDRIYDLVTFENIINFEETIYLSKKTFWSVPMEKHSFQFLIKDFLVDKKNWKEFNNLINQNKHYHNNKYKFLNKNNDIKNDIELKIIPVDNALVKENYPMEWLEYWNAPNDYY